MPATPGPDAMSYSCNLLGMSAGTEVDQVGMSDNAKFTGLITVHKATGVHPKIVDPLIAAAFACLLLLLLDAASSMMSSCGLHCVHVFAR